MVETRSSESIRLSRPLPWGAILGLQFSVVRLPIFRKFKNIIVRYPAVISGIFIYSYYIFTSIEWYTNWKMNQIETFGWVSQFDALLWMWLLSYAFVKVLNLRERLHAEEQRRLIQNNQLREKESQLRTLQTINLTLKDMINNPLAIIHEYLRRIDVRWGFDQETAEDIRTVRQAAERIHNVVQQLDSVKEYRTVQQSYGSLLEIQ